MKVGEEKLCGKLNFSMYGILDAAQNWYQEYLEQLIQIGFQQGKASPCLFYNEDKGIRTYVHGDDYVSTGKPEALKLMKGQLEKKYTVKTQILGPGQGDQQCIKIFNRVFTWTAKEGKTYGADPRHVEIILKQLDMTNAKSVITPGTREEGRTSEDSKTELGDKDAALYRAIVARCKHLSPDRPDISFSVKEFARSMSKPTNGDQQRLKRLARYFKGKPRLVLHYPWQLQQSAVTTYSDADWVGYRENRKSTTGGCIKIGKHCVKGWSKPHALIALSSGESEFYVSVKAAAETFGTLAILKDIGWHLNGEVWEDANAALGIIQRTGLGKTRHIETGLLWIQQVAAQQRFKFGKVLGTSNPADLFTK